MSGVSEEMTCPYCGFKGAQANYESRGAGRGETEYCDICGYYSYEPKEGYDEWEEDGMTAGVQKPEEEILEKAKEVAMWVEWTWEIDDDDVVDSVQEVLMGGEIPDWIKEDIIEKKFIEVLFPEE